jgi:hypothetical protein
LCVSTEYLLVRSVHDDVIDFQNLGEKIKGKREKIKQLKVKSRRMMEKKLSAVRCSTAK